MEEEASRHDPFLEAAWYTRQKYWQRKLGRLRLGVEPLEEQLAKYRRVTWAITAIAAGLSLMFVGLFTAFARPDVGLILVAILFAPVVSLAWLDFGILALRAARYQRELREYERRQPTPGRT